MCAWFALGASHSSSIGAIKHTVYLVKPHVIILDIGANDTDNCCRPNNPLIIAEDVFRFAKELLESSSASFIFVLSSYHRFQGLEFRRPDYEDILPQFNEALRTLARNHDYIIYTGHT